MTPSTDVPHITSHSTPMLHDVEHGGHLYHTSALRPIIERIRVVIKKIRQKVAGSWKECEADLHQTG